MSELLPTAPAPEVWRALRRLVRPHRLLAVAAVGTLVAATAAGLVVPPVLGHIVDVVVDHRGAGAVTGPVLLLALAAVVQAGLTGLGNLLVARLGETMLAGLRERVVDRALDLPLEQVERAGSGDLVARVSGDVQTVASAVRGALPALAGAGLTIGLTLAGLAVLDWPFAIAALLAAPIQLHTLRWYLRHSTPLYAAERVAEGARTQQLLDSVGGADTVRAFGLTATHVQAVGQRSRAAMDYALSANRLATRFFGRLNLAEFVGLAAILLTGYWLVRDHGTSVGTTAAAALYFHRLFDPINTLLALFGTAQEAAAGLARLVGVANVPAQPGERVAGATGAAAVRVDAVSFRYASGRPVLHDITLHLDAGEHVALVGASGAGKTTLAKLIAGVHQPATGRLTTGGEVALVTQEVHVFAGTVAEDLRLAAPAASDEQLLVALELVSARGWVEALPDGLATLVGAGAHALTATEAQQLALARLVLLGPAVAILDEATADSGSAGARLLDEAASAALAGRTALVVAHRLSQAATADRIVVLDSGRIVETGSHEQLVEKGGAYARLWQAWAGRVAGAA